VITIEFVEAGFGAKPQKAKAVAGDGQDGILGEPLLDRERPEEKMGPELGGEWQREGDKGEGQEERERGKSKGEEGVGGRQAAGLAGGLGWPGLTERARGREPAGMLATGSVIWLAGGLGLAGRHGLGSIYGLGGMPGRACWFGLMGVPGTAAGARGIRRQRGRQRFPIRIAGIIYLQVLQPLMTFLNHRSARFLQY